MTTTGVNNFFLISKYFFATSDLQNIHLDIDIQNICELEADIKLYTLIIYLVGHFVKIMYNYLDFNIPIQSWLEADIQRVFLYSKWNFLFLSLN